MYRKALLVPLAAMALGVAGIPAAAGHSSSPRMHVIESQDDCEPISFNAALQDPQACVGAGKTTFDESIAQMLDDGEVDGWEFDSDELKIRTGETVEVRGVGGEFHTFTKVKEFGGGCVQEINTLLNLKPVVECDDLVAPPGAPIGVKVPRGFLEDGVPPGVTRKVPAAKLTPGTHKFECLIHPWMHAEVKVRAAHH